MLGGQGHRGGKPNPPASCVGGTSRQLQPASGFPRVSADDRPATVFIERSRQDRFKQRPRTRRHKGATLSSGKPAETRRPSFAAAKTERGSSPQRDGGPQPKHLTRSQRSSHCASSRQHTSGLLSAARPGGAEDASPTRNGFGAFRDESERDGQAPPCGSGGAHKIEDCMGEQVAKGRVGELHLPSETLGPPERENFAGLDPRTPASDVLPAPGSPYPTRSTVPARGRSGTARGHLALACRPATASRQVVTVPAVAMVGMFELQQTRLRLGSGIGA